MVSPNSAYIGNIAIFDHVVHRIGFSSRVNLVYNTDTHPHTLSLSLPFSLFDFPRLHRFNYSAG